MIEFIGFVILVFWIANISNRMAVLEKKLKQGGVSLPAAEPAHAAQPMPIEKGFLQPSPVTESQAANSLHTLKMEKTLTAGEQTEIATGWLTKIGVLAVIFGVGFFIKYAIDMGWISEWMRIMIGIGAGALLCILGHLWRNKYPNYASAITGGGLALMYFSIFAAYQFYQLVPQAVALVFMVGVSGLGVYLSYLRKSSVLAGLSTIGAYFSPVFLHAGVDQHTGLFIYLAILNISAIIITFYYYWNELLFLVFLGTGLDYMLWAANYLNTSNTVAAASFAAFTFLLLALGSAAAYRKHHLSNTLPAEAGNYLGALVVLLGAFYSISIGILLYKNFHSYLNGFALLGAVGIFIAYILIDRLESERVNYSFAFVGTGLLALACIWQFTGKTTDFMLIALGLLMVVVSVTLKRPELRFWGLAELICCVFAVLFEPYDVANYIFIFNGKFGLIMAETAALWITGWLYSSVEASGSELQASEIAHSIGSLLLWFGFSWEIVQYFMNSDSENVRNLMLTLWWIGYATVLMIFGALAKSSTYKKISAAIFALAILKVFLYDVLALDTGYRVVSFIVLGVILLSVSFGYQKNKEKISKFLGVDNPNANAPLKS